MKLPDRNRFKNDTSKMYSLHCVGPIQRCSMVSKSLERSPAVGDFYGTGIEIWAGFGPVRQLLRPVFSCFHGQRKNFKNILDGENIFGIQ